MTQAIRKFLANRDGATAIEYALISSLIALMLVTSLTALGSRMGRTFTQVSAALK